MKAVILAAGRGSRLGSLTDDRPKGMVHAAGRPLLDWQHAAFRAVGICDITVITGYCGHLVSSYGFKTLFNKDWERGNMVSSLACALESIPGSLLVAYADILYKPQILRSLINCTAPMALTYDLEWLELWRRRFEAPLDDAESFRVDDHCRVTEIGGRPTTEQEIQGQFMGILKLLPPARAWIGSALDADPNARLNLDTTRLISRILANGHAVTGVAIHGGWCEIDSTRDLAIAEALIAEKKIELYDERKA